MKHISKRLASIAIITMLGISATMAQEIKIKEKLSPKKKIEFSIYQGIRNIPIGSLTNTQIMTLDGYRPVLSEYSEEYPGGVIGFGHFNLGAKLKLNFEKIKGLGIIATADYFYISSTTTPIGNDEYEVFSGRGDFRNIPIMAGVNYTNKISRRISFWCETAIGFNFRKLKNRYVYLNSMPVEENEEEVQLKWQFNDYNYLYEEDYENNITYASQISSGIKVGRVSFGVYYYHLGKASVKGTYNISHRYYDEEERKNKWITLTENQPFKYGVLKTSMLVIRVGVHF